MKREQLIEARLSRHWSQAEAAEALGINVVTLSRWENSHTTPHQQQLRQLCEVYNKSATELDLGSAYPQEKDTISMTERLERSINEDLSIKLMRIIWGWTGFNLEDLQQQISFEITEHAATVTRRQALRSIMLLPIGLAGGKSLATGEIITQCAAGVTAAWHERRGSELQLAHDAMNTYIHLLKRVYEKSTNQQKQAATDLLVQCYVLRGTLARHLTGNEAGLAQLQKALHFSQEASDEQKILTLRTIAATHDYNNAADQALHFGRAAAQPKCGSLHLQSFVYSGLATYQANTGNRREALQSMDKAQSAFFAQPAHVAAPAWIDHDRMNLLVNAGETYLHLQDYQAAADALDQAAQLPEEDGSATGRAMAIIDRINIEVVRDDQERDMEQCITLWTHSLGEARRLQSQQLLNEAKYSYQLMRAAWPGEHRIKDLREQIITH